MYRVSDYSREDLVQLLEQQILSAPCEEREA